MVVGVRAGTERCEEDRPDGSRLLDPGSGRNFRRLSAPAPCLFGRHVRCLRCCRHVMLALRQNLLPCDLAKHSVDIVLTHLRMT